MEVVPTPFENPQHFPNPGISPGFENPRVYLLRTYTSKTNHLSEYQACRQATAQYRQVTFLCFRHSKDSEILEAGNC
jgi:hypothetical protein